MARKTEMQRGKPLEKPEKVFAPAAGNEISSADATIINRLKDLVPEKARHALRLSAQKAALTASGLYLLLSSGCGNIPNPFSHSQEASPTPVVNTKKDIPKSTSTLEVAATPTPIPHVTEIPHTSRVEMQQPKIISMGGSVEPDLASRSAGETIKLVFPEEIVHGESPLIPKGDKLSISFKLKSATPVQRLSLSLSDLLGTQDNKFSIAMYDNDINIDATPGIASAIRTLQRTAKLSISDANQEIINKITLRSSKDSNGVLAVSMSMPNEQITYSDKYGVHSLNPAEMLASGKVGLLDINRRGKSASGIATTPIALAVENIMIKNGEEKLVATADRFDITPPTRAPVSTRSPEITQVPVKSPSPTIKATKIPTPEPKEEANKWTRKWDPNVTVSVREWWDDMVAKGYISIDAIAQQYAGERINNFLKVANLVPNPVKYYLQGHSFINNCNLELDKLVMQGQGHIKITSDAYTQIPGGVECQIFTKSK